MQRCDPEPDELRTLLRGEQRVGATFDPPLGGLNDGIQATVIVELVRQRFDAFLGNRRKRVTGRDPRECDQITRSQRFSQFSRSPHFGLAAELLAQLSGAESQLPSGLFPDVAKRCSDLNVVRLEE